MLAMKLVNKFKRDLPKETEEERRDKEEQGKERTVEIRIMET